MENRRRFASANRRRFASAKDGESLGLTAIFTPQAFGRRLLYSRLRPGGSAIGLNRLRAARARNPKLSRDCRVGQAIVRRSTTLPQDVADRTLIEGLRALSC